MSVAEAARLVHDEARRGFALEEGPLVRIRLVRLAGRHHVLSVVMHHIVSDGWSMRIFVREVTALYTAYSRGQDSPVPDLPIQYADFAAWQQERLTDDVLGKQLAYWRDQLGGMTRLVLPPGSGAVDWEAAVWVNGRLVARSAPEA